jgi:uncharacterized protein
MLPAALVRARVRGGSVQPIRPDLSDPLLLDLAEQVHAVFAQAAEQHLRLGEVLAELDDLASDTPDPKLARGLIRTAEQQCETGASGVEDPAVFRMLAFHRAAQHGPLTLGSGLTGRDVLAGLAHERGLDPARVEEDLYGDLPLERRVLTYSAPAPRWLLHRYDVSQVQSLLAASTGIQVVLQAPTMPRMRQLVRWIKFFRLLHTARLVDDRLELALDGPMSMFGPSNRYGTSLAGVFPALLLQDCEWTLTATVSWRRGPPRGLTVTSSDGYVGHYADAGGYVNKVHEHFAARFVEQERDFALADGALPVTLADRDLLFPDFTLTHHSGAAVHLEILGYWQPDRLLQRLDALDRSGNDNLVLAVGRKLAASQGAVVPEHPRVVTYSELLSVDKVLACARRCIPAAGTPPRSRNAR